MTSARPLDEMALRRDLVTPEGTVLQFDFAGAGERLVAFALDALMIFLSLIGLMIILGLLRSELIAAAVILASFAITQFWFTFFELRWQGRTPGKRWTDLRVIDRRGGRLTAAAIFTRNFTRLVEVELPLILLADPEGLTGRTEPWLVPVLWSWVFVLGAFPLFNRDRLRLGDLIAGTAVVHAPKAVLLPDLSHAPPARKELVPSDYAFTPEQLAVYGIFELQVLEELLRRARPDRKQALDAVLVKVVQKIGWSASGPIDAERFLSAFYAAQRARLEQALLFGDRKERKSR